MTNKSTNKSNAEVARGILRGNVRDPSAEYAAIHDQIVLALDAAQSQLARDVLAEISTMPGGTHGGGLIVVARDAAVERLRDLFTRLNIKIGEG